MKSYFEVYEDSLFSGRLCGPELCNSSPESSLRGTAMLPEYSFTNGSPRRLLLVVEPKSLEYWVDSKATVKIVVEHSSLDRAVEFEITTSGLIAYVPNDSSIRVVMNGKEVIGHLPTRTMVRKLD